jgi:hypothetical protein
MISPDVCPGDMVPLWMGYILPITSMRKKDAYAYGLWVRGTTLCLLCLVSIRRQSIGAPLAVVSDLHRVVRHFGHRCKAQQVLPVLLARCDKREVGISLQIALLHFGRWSGVESPEMVTQIFLKIRTVPHPSSTPIVFSAVDGKSYRHPVIQ